jgi:phosphatidylglycerophosphatase A
LLGAAAGWASLGLVPSGAAAQTGFLAASAAAACWVCGEAERHFDRRDDPRIVLDEVVGFWTAAAFLPRGFSAMLPAFVLFRILDSAKIAPLRRLEGLPGGIGVVFDDIAAGVLANLCVRAAGLALPGWMG